MDELRLSLLALFVVLIGGIYIRERLRGNRDDAKPLGDAVDLPAGDRATGTRGPHRAASAWRALREAAGNRLRATGVAEASGREPATRHTSPDTDRSAGQTDPGGLSAARKTDERESVAFARVEAPMSPEPGELGDVSAVRADTRDVPLGDIELLRVEPAVAGTEDARPQGQLELDIGAPPAAPRSRGRRARKRDAADGSNDGAGAPGSADSPARGEMIVVLHVMQSDAAKMPGVSVRRALENAGLVLGEMQIYHHHGVAESDGAPVFSVARAIEPGTFDPDDENSFETPGLTLFMRLPGAQDGVVILELMFAAAQSLARALDATVLDERRSTLSAQALNHLRDQVSDFSRRQRLGNGS